MANTGLQVFAQQPGQLDAKDVIERCTWAAAFATAADGHKAVL
jgi:hypothetical protein